MTWTPEREAVLRRMWGEGRSASEIARELGGVTRHGVIGKGHRLGLGRETVVHLTASARAVGRAVVKARARAKPVCAVPGCGKELGKSNRSGVCMAHNHAPGRCQCPKCRGEVAARRNATPQDRPDVRRVLVQSSGQGTSGLGTHVSVSLPREPWVKA